MSTFGSHFRVTTYGESHCASVGCIVDGCPPGMALSDDDVQVQLSRRRPGQSNLTTPRDEKDRVQIQSGVEKGITLGTPIAMRVQNQDQRPNDYTDRTLDLYPRPSHADYTYLEKYGVKASSGGGRSSARETIGRVAAGAVAEKYLKDAFGVEIVAFVSSVGKIHIPRFPDESLTIAAKDAHDSIGGTVTCVIRGVPIGLGEPCFDKLEAKLAHAMLSIPATKAFEVGSGFRGTEVPGSKHNDAFVRRADGKLGTLTNWSGGIQGGITNGEDIYFRIGFKSPATISQEQRTASYAGEDGILTTRGRHDPCVVPRAVPIVEAMAALVIIDAVLAQDGRVASSARLPPGPVRALPPSMRRADDPQAEAEKAAHQAGEKVIDAQ
ncbi:unnamed protein product [Tilletia controversa]|nr:unnamed protein product [Tilletia controversa]